LSAARVVNPTIRLDAEFFSKTALHYLARTKMGPVDCVRAIVETVKHPVEVLREYEDIGLLAIMAKNVRDNHVDMTDLRFKPYDLLPAVSKNELHFDAYGGEFWSSCTMERKGYQSVCVCRCPNIP
jgi:hypothetical protein